VVGVLLLLLVVALHLLMLLSKVGLIQEIIMRGRLLLLVLVLVVLPGRSWKPGGRVGRQQGVIEQGIHVVVAARKRPWRLQKLVLLIADLSQPGSWHRLPPP